MVARNWAAVALALLGYASTPERAGAIFYQSTGRPAGRLALAVRLGSPGFEGRRTFFLDAEVATRFGGHFGAVLNLRHGELPMALGARLWLRPITVGLRIQ